jgi:uncharacterized membrane protein YgdD (TMEM256/DUF423 family)
MSGWARLAAGLIAAGTALGAFGAHALKGRVEPEMLQVYQTGVFYHLVNAVGLLAASAGAASGPAVGGRGSAGAPRAARIAITAGIVVFAGSLYVLAVSGVRWLGAVTPIGGTLLIGGWLTLAFVKGSDERSVR